jgi:hypothetical protein
MRVSATSSPGLLNVILTLGLVLAVRDSRVVRAGATSSIRACGDRHDHVPRTDAPPSREK